MAGEWKRNGFPERPKRGIGEPGRRRLQEIEDALTAPDRYDENQPVDHRRLPTASRPYGIQGVSNFIPTGTDFGPFTLDEADVYYQGPYRSTRVRAHQFVPDDPEIISKIEQATEAGVLNRQQLYDFNITGKIYVRFIKHNSLWRYGVYTPIPLSEYRNFRNSPSKGKSVRFLEQYGHGWANDGVEGVLI